MLQSIQDNTNKEIMEEKTDIKQDDYFGTKPEQEILRNVSNTIGGIINSEKVEEETTTEKTSEEPTVDPTVEAVGKAITNLKPKGVFVQGISNMHIKPPKES